MTAWIAQATPPATKIAVTSPSALAAAAGAGRATGFGAMPVTFFANRFAPPKQPWMTDAHWMGGFHEAVQRDLLATIRGAGGQAVSEVDLIAVDRTTARADIFGRPPRHERVISIEIKTGFAEVKPNQERVYNFLLLGNHVMTPNRKVRDVGLEPDTLLPPLEVLIIFAAGPGAPLDPYYITPEHETAETAPK